MNARPPWLERARDFSDRFGGEIPLLLAPMAGACPPELSIAVMRAGGWGAAGALLMPPEEIAHWCSTVRAAVEGPFQVNLWIPEADAPIDADVIAAQARAFSPDPFDSFLPTYRQVIHYRYHHIVTMASS